VNTFGGFGHRVEVASASVIHWIFARIRENVSDWHIRARRRKRQPLSGDFMEDRYPYIRFVIDSAQVIAAAVAVIMFLSGTTTSCQYGGFGGFVSFLVTLAVAAISYVVLMVCIAALRLFMDIESSTRQIAESGKAEKPAAPSEPQA
jgi:uncharacterized membrane protein